jgi:hypothetical protein
MVLPLLQERLATCKANRFERAFFHTSKRFAKEEREVGHKPTTRDNIMLASSTAHPAAAFVKCLRIGFAALVRDITTGSTVVRQRLTEVLPKGVKGLQYSQSKLMFKVCMWPISQP